MTTIATTKRKADVLTTSYIKLQRNLQKYAYSRTNNREVAEDLIQDTFLKTWKYLVKGGNVKNMEAFLFHVLKSNIIDEYRKPTKSFSLDVLMEKGTTPYIDTTMRLIDELDGGKASQLIDELPLTYQNVIRMRFINNLSLDEISHATGQNKNTVAAQTCRGLKKLKTLYAEKSTRGVNSVVKV